MSRLAILLTSLFLFSGFAAAGIAAPGCLASLEWTFNSLGQDPCVVAAFLLSTCNGGSFTIDPLPAGYSYGGPSGPDDGNLCECNTVVYSLISACDACQGEEWIAYATYAHNCTRVVVPGEFPNPIPAGTAVPYWAFAIDPTVLGIWDNIAAEAVGGLPEAGPGTVLAPPASY